MVEDNKNTPTVVTKGKVANAYLANLKSSGQAEKPVANPNLAVQELSGRKSEGAPSPTVAKTEYAHKIETNAEKVARLAASGQVPVKGTIHVESPPSSPKVSNLRKNYGGQGL